jgi:hypothetical protein
MGTDMVGSAPMQISLGRSSHPRDAGWFGSVLSARRILPVCWPINAEWLADRSVSRRYLGKKPLTIATVPATNKILRKHTIFVIFN